MIPRDEVDPFDELVDEDDDQGDDQGDDEPDEAPHEFERWQRLGEQYREMAHQLRLPLMEMRRQLAEEPRDAMYPSTRLAGGRVVSQTQGVVNQLEDLASRSEQLAWSEYHEYLLRELSVDG